MVSIWQNNQIFTILAVLRQSVKYKVGPISVALRLGRSFELPKKGRSGGECLATPCPIWKVTEANSSLPHRQRCCHHQVKRSNDQKTWKFKKFTISRSIHLPTVLDFCEVQSLTVWSDNEIGSPSSPNSCKPVKPICWLSPQVESKCSFTPCKMNK